MKADQPSVHQVKAEQRHQWTVALSCYLWAYNRHTINICHHQQQQHCQYIQFCHLYHTTLIHAIRYPNNITSHSFQHATKKDNFDNICMQYNSSCNVRATWPNRDENRNTETYFALTVFTFFPILSFLTLRFFPTWSNNPAIVWSKPVEKKQNYHKNQQLGY